MKNPIQPLTKDPHGTLRFKSNAIVEHLLEVAKKHGCGLNEIACMDFTPEDRQQLAQLIGYSLSGYSELSYVDDDAYGAATEMANGKTEDKARIKHLERELKAVRAAVGDPTGKLMQSELVEHCQKLREERDWMAHLLTTIRDKADIRYGKNRGLLAFSDLKDEAARSRPNTVHQPTPAE